MSIQSIRCALLALSLAFGSAAFAADDPTMHQVYVAAQAGRFGQAQAMMDVVLRDHPNSGKAHFVEAELLARQGRLAEAKAELSTAERLKPGLPFATPTAVSNLRAQIAGSRAPATADPAQQYAADGGGMPWGLMIVAFGLIAAVLWIARAMRRRAQQVYAPNAMQGYGTAMPGYGPGAGGQMMPPPAAGGIGSGILGGLATGAAVGAGIVAGEALMHHFTDGDRSERAYAPPRDDLPAPDDMGGADFGVSDSSSWDDGGGSGDDWN